MIKIFSLILISVMALASVSAVQGQQVFDSEISMYGLAIPKQQATLRATVDSHIIDIPVHEGQMVRKGDLLVELDGSEAKAKKEIAELEATAMGQRLSAEAELEYAKADHARIKTLYQQKAANERELNESSLRLKRARASLQSAIEKKFAGQARFMLASAELEKYYLRAPFDGQITHIATNIGESVSQNNDILQIASLDKFRVDIYLPIEKARNMKTGQTQSLIVEGLPDVQPVDGTVVFQSPMIEAATGTLRLVFEIDNRQLNLPAGFSVRLAE